MQAVSLRDRAPLSRGVTVAHGRRAKSKIKLATKLLLCEGHAKLHAGVGLLQHELPSPLSLLWLLQPHAGIRWERQRLLQRTDVQDLPMQGLAALPGRLQQHRARRLRALLLRADQSVLAERKCECGYFIVPRGLLQPTHLQVLSVQDSSSMSNWLVGASRR